MGWIDNNVLNFRNSPAQGSGLLSEIPVTGPLGMLYISTDTQALYRYDGSGWVLIGGPGTGTLTGSGSVGKLAKFTGATVLGDSIVSESGSMLTVNGSITANAFIVPLGTSAQFLKADGSLDGTAYIPTAAIGVTVQPYNANTTILGNTTTGTGSIVLNNQPALILPSFTAIQVTGGIASLPTGNGTLVYASTLTGYVPYTGATASVDLGLFNLAAKRVNINNAIDSATYSLNNLGGTQLEGTIYANTIYNNVLLSTTQTTNISNGFNLLSKDSKWGIRTNTSYDLLIDVNNSGSPLTAFYLTNSGNKLYNYGYISAKNNFINAGTNAIPIYEDAIIFNPAAGIGFTANAGFQVGNSFNNSVGTSVKLFVNSNSGVNTPVDIFTAKYDGSFNIVGITNTASRLNVNGAPDNSLYAMSVLGDVNLGSGSLLATTVTVAGTTNGGIYFGSVGRIRYNTSVSFMQVVDAAGSNVIDFQIKDLYATQGFFAGEISSTSLVNGTKISLSTQNTSTATNAVNLIRFGNDVSQQAFTIRLYSSVHATNPNECEIINQVNGNLYLGGWGTSAMYLANGGIIYTNSRININGATDSASYSINVIGGINNTSGNNYFNSTSGVTSIGTSTNTYKLNVSGGIYDSDTQATLNQSKFGVFGGMTFTATGTESAQYINAGVAGGYVMAAAGSFTPLAKAKQGAIVGSYYMTAASTVTGIQNAIYANCELASSGTITTLATIRAGQPDQFSGGSAFTGTITNMVGIYIDDISGSSLASKFTNKYGIYQVGTSDKNFFGGEIILGSGQVVSASVLNTVTNKVKFTINGTDLYFLASTSAT